MWACVASGVGTAGVWHALVCVCLVRMHGGSVDTRMIRAYAGVMPATPFPVKGSPMSEFPFTTVDAAHAHAVDNRQCMMVTTDSAGINPVHRHCTATATHLVTYGYRMTSDGGRVLIECAVHAVSESMRYGADMAELADTTRTVVS